MVTNFQTLERGSLRTDEIEITRSHVEALASVDSNKIHCDDTYARDFGKKFNLPIRGRILHGTTTLAIGLTKMFREPDISENYCPENLVSVNARFLGVIQPGDKIYYKMARNNGEVSIVCLNSDDNKVLEAEICIGIRKPTMSFENFLSPPEFFEAEKRIGEWGDLMNHRSSANAYKTPPKEKDSYVESRGMPLWHFEKGIEEDIGLGLVALADMPIISGVLGERFPGRNTLWGSHSGRIFSTNSWENYFGESVVDIAVKDEPKIDATKKLVKVRLNTRVFGGLRLPSSLKFSGEEIVFVPNPYYRKDLQRVN